MSKKTMFRVEKFIPNECPKCRQKFLKEGKTYTRLFGDIVDGRKVVRETTGYDIIICEKCKNCTARIKLEACQLADRREAEALLESGFVNLHSVEAWGSDMKDRHEVFAEMPKISVMSLKL